MITILKFDISGYESQEVKLIRFKNNFLEQIMIAQVSKALLLEKMGEIMEIKIFRILATERISIRNRKNPSIKRHA